MSVLYHLFSLGFFLAPAHIVTIHREKKNPAAIVVIPARLSGTIGYR